MAEMKAWGAPKKIETPEILWDLAMQYFNHVDNTPWFKNELIKSGDLAGCIIKVPTQQPYTWSGLEVFVFDAGYNTRLDEYKSNRKGGYANFSDVVKAINQRMYRQKFAGAAVGAFNASIISADLGLIQRTLTEVKDTTDEFDYDALSESALDEIANARRKTDE